MGTHGFYMGVACFYQTWWASVTVVSLCTTLSSALPTLRTMAVRSIACFTTNHLSSQRQCAVSGSHHIHNPPLHVVMHVLMHVVMHVVHAVLDPMHTKCSAPCSMHLLHLHGSI